MDADELDIDELDLIVSLVQEHGDKISNSPTTDFPKSQASELNAINVLIGKLKAIRAEWDNDDPWAEDKRLLAALRDHRTELEDYLLNAPSSNFSASAQTVTARRDELGMTQNLIIAIVKKLGDR